MSETDWYTRCPQKSLKKKKEEVKQTLNFFCAGKRGKGPHSGLFNHRKAYKDILLSSLGHLNAKTLTFQPKNKFKIPDWLLMIPIRVSEEM